MSEEVDETPQAQRASGQCDEQEDRHGTEHGFRAPLVHERCGLRPISQIHFADFDCDGGPHVGGGYGKPHGLGAGGRGSDSGPNTG